MSSELLIYLFFHFKNGTYITVVILYLQQLTDLDIISINLISLKYDTWKFPLNRCKRHAPKFAKKQLRNYNGVKGDFRSIWKLTSKSSYMIYKSCKRCLEPISRIMLCPIWLAPSGRSVLKTIFSFQFVYSKTIVRYPAI